MLFLNEYEYANPISVMSNRPVQEQESLNQKKSYITTGSQRWDLMITLETIPPGESEKLARLRAKIAGLSNRDSFEIIMPQYVTPPNQRVWTTGEHTVQKTVIQIAQSIIIPIGLYIKFQNHRKVYEVKDSYIRHGTGTFIEIEPGLHETVASAEDIDMSPMISVNFKTGQQFGFRTNRMGEWIPELRLQEVPY